MDEVRCADCHKENTLKVVSADEFHFKIECDDCGWWAKIVIGAFGGVHCSSKDNPNGALYM